MMNELGNDDVVWCEECKFFCNADVGGEGECSVHEVSTWYGHDASLCPYFKSIKAGSD